MFKMKYNEYIETVFYNFQIIIFEAPVLEKRYTITDHVNNILKSLLIRHLKKS